MIQLPTIETTMSDKSMNKICMSIIAATAFLLAPGAHASVVSFDDLDADATLSSLEDTGTYAGFTWSQWYLGDTAVEGYGNAARSGINYAMNGWGVDALEIAGSGAFTFTGAWFAAPEINGGRASWVSIDAYDALGALVGSTGQVAIDGVHRWVAGGFANVSRLVVSRDEGFFAMDDFSFEAASPVPEPGTSALLAASALALVLTRRRREEKEAR